MTPRISVVINTMNESRNLPFALRSVADWTDEVIVVDMHSVDDTREIALSFGAHVYLHERLGFADPARAFAVSKASGDWILMLDADEIVSRPLARELIRLAHRQDVDAVRLPFRNYLFGAPFRATGWGPHQATHLRFFRPRGIDLSDTIHQYIREAPNAHVYYVPYRPGLAIVHFNYTTARHFIEKTNRYTTIEADQAIARGESVGVLGLMLGPARVFYRHYFKYRGYRDGWRGFQLSALMCIYRYLTLAKVRELRRVGTEAMVDSHYRALAEAWLNAEDGEPDV